MMSQPVLMTPITQLEFEAAEKSNTRAAAGEYHAADSPTFCKYTISAQALLRHRVFPTWRTSKDGASYIGEYQKHRTVAFAITYANLAKKPHLFKKGTGVDFDPNYDNFALPPKPVIVYHCKKCDVHVVKDGNHRLLRCAYHGCDPNLEVYQVASSDWSGARVDMKNFCSCYEALELAT
jgi:hypothetical protein